MSSPPPAKRIHITPLEDPILIYSNNSNKSNHFDTVMAVNGESTIDESLYSRQLYVMGTEGMKRLASNNILISGLGGLGLEIAKNIVLGGVKSVTLHDPDSITATELSSNYYATPSDIGKNRCDVIKHKLVELNSYVTIETLKVEKLTSEILSNYQVVVLARGFSEEWKEISNICHSKSIKLIITKTCGLFGQIFCDFCPHFSVIDNNGEPPLSIMLQSIEKSEQGLVLCLEETKHGFFDGQYVTFSEVKGMTELNGCAPRKVRVLGPDAFSIGDTSTLSEYTGGGVCTQVKVPEEINFVEFSESFFKPDIVFSDFAKFENPAQLHIFFEALSKFQSKNKRIPLPWNEDDAELFLKCVHAVNSSVENTECHVDKINESLAKIFSFICAGECCPIQSVIGGIVAQEILKACTGRFSPIKQWFYFDAIECLPEPMCRGTVELLKDEIKPNNLRYEGQCNIFGKHLQEKLGDLNYFIVGAGAIGCELLKLFSMMGVSCGKGKLYVTDMDIIEKSNLNRQFLFRPSDVTKGKSLVAALASKKINPDFNIEAHENRVGPETESVYDDNFFNSLDGVALALDNVEARTYIDRRCVYYRKSLLDSGTLGTKGSVQVVIPHKTESYGSTQDPPEKSIPMCTLKNFPYQIEHTIEWARDSFEGFFVQQSEAIEAYLKNHTDFISKVTSGSGNQATDILETLKSNIKTSRPKKFEDCITWARQLWQELFSNSIRQLLFNFPSEHKTTSGTPFWSGTKRCPHPLTFDPKDPTHLAFIVSAANLRAYIYGIPLMRDNAEIAEIVAKIQVPDFVPRSGVTIDVNDSEMQARANGGASNYNKLEELQKSLPKPDELKDMKVNLVDFEKDDDTNFHIDFIVATSNLRAANYSISPADRLQTKLIAGKIMPAIATTTSMISGLVCLELIKLVQQHQHLELYKNSFINLALPMFAPSEPMKPNSFKFYDKTFTIWDRFEVKGEMTLQQFLDYFKKEHKLDITMLSQDVSMIYSFFMPQNKLADRLNMKMHKLVELISKKPLAPHVRALVFEICASDLSGEDLDVPYVRYVINPKDV